LRSPFPMVFGSNSSRVTAFGLLNKPLTRPSLERTLRFASRLWKDGKTDRAVREVASSLALEVVFSPKLIPKLSKKAKRYPNSKVPRRAKYEISPVWKTAPPSAYKRSCRLSSLLRKVAQAGCVPNYAHDLMRLSRYAWIMSPRDFDGLCRRLETKAFPYIISSPETALRGKLNANPDSTSEEVGYPTYIRNYNKFRYGCKNRPSCLGGALLLINAMRRKRPKAQDSLHLRE
jgi:hypothetical protein